MANTTVAILRYCKTEWGWKRLPAALDKRGKPKADMARVGTEERHYPQGRFQLRYYDGRKAIYQDVGNDPSDVQQAQRKRVEELALELQARHAGVTLIEQDNQRKTLKALRDASLREKRLCSTDCSSLYRLALDEFIASVAKIYPEQLEKTDFIRYCETVEQRLSDRTRANRFGALMTFIRFCIEEGSELNLDRLLPKKDRAKMKKYTQTEPTAYSVEEIQKLLAVSPPYSSLVFDFLVNTGFRMAEAMFLEWTDIDFIHRTVSVRNKPDLGVGPKGKKLSFAPKGRRERSVPLIREPF